MDKREAKRWARVMAANVIISALESGWEVDNATDDGSDKETVMLAAALREVAAEVEQRLPAGWEMPPRRALSRGRDEA